MSSRAARPDWVSDKDRPTCTSCEKKFTAVRRRHHCRVCGEVYCGNCCHSRINIPELGYTTKTRVCKACKERYVTTGTFTVEPKESARAPPTLSTTPSVVATPTPAAAPLSKPAATGPKLAPPPMLSAMGTEPASPRKADELPPPKVISPRNAPHTSPRNAPHTSPEPNQVIKAHPPPTRALPPHGSTNAEPKKVRSLPQIPGGGAAQKQGASVLPSRPPLPAIPPPKAPPKHLSEDDREALEGEHKEEVVQPRIRSDTQLTQRSNVIREFVTTENAYVRHLEVIVNKFLVPIRAQQLLPMLELGEIFSNVEIIAMSNAELLQDLEALIMKARRGDTIAEDCAIGEVFLKHVHELIPIYTPYCLNQGKCVETFDRIIQSKKMAAFSNFVKEAQKDPQCESLPLMSFLIKPVQRLCKYPLLLRELIKATDESHVDYQHLITAMKLTQDLVDEVNSSKREAENVRKMLQVTKQLAGADNLKLMMPGRQFIRDGRLTKISVHNKHQERQFVLFNDMLIYAARSTGPMSRKKYQFKGMLRLDQIKLVDMEDSESLSNAFCIVRQDSVKKKYVVYSKEAKGKSEWLDALQKAVAAAQNSAQSGPTNVFLEAEEAGAEAASSSSGVAFKVVKSSGITSAQQLKMVQVENRVSGWKNEDANRFLVREGGPFTAVAEGGGEAHRYLFLFNDSVLLTSKHSEKSFVHKAFFLTKQLQVKPDPVGGLALHPKNHHSVTLCFSSLPEQKSWKADFLRAGALEEGGGWGASQATLTGKIKAVRVRIINPSLAEYGLKDTFKTLSLTPDTTAAELEERIMQKVLSRIKPEDRDIVRNGCEGYRLYEENMETGITTTLPPDAKPYGSGNQLLFRRPS